MFKMISYSLVVTLVASTLINAAPAPATDAELLNRAVSHYAPISAACPSTPLVRPATSLGSEEASYISSRKSKADVSLSSWLKQRGSFSTSDYPVIGFASSGGGYRALLETAGVVQGFDVRDSNVGTSGVYQALTYESGLSGGSWFLSSLAGNNWPTVTSLNHGLWERAFQNSLLVPANLLSISGLTEYAAITTEIAAKQAAGYDATIVDPYGRLLSYQLLYGKDGGVAVRLSGLASLSNFTSHNVPYPIIITTTDFPEKDQCYPTLSGPIFEVSLVAYTLFLRHNDEHGHFPKDILITSLVPSL